MEKLKDYNVFSKEGKMEKMDAYWLHTNGDIINVPITHIRAIMDSPEFFGLTIKEIHKKYDEFKEPYGFEGKARISILKNLIKNMGWIRLRFNMRHYRWIIESGTLDNAHKVAINALLELMLSMEITNNQTDIMMNNLSNEESKRMAVEKFINDDYHK